MSLQLRPSFARGTLVTTPGGAVAIQDLRAGDVVYLFSPKTGFNDQVTVASVTETPGSPLPTYSVTVDGVPADARAAVKLLAADAGERSHR